MDMKIHTMEKDPEVECQMQGHKSEINCVAFNLKDKSLASGDNSNIIMVWNLKKTSNALKLQGHTGPIYDLSFSSRNNLLASASHDKTVRLWVPSYSGRTSDFRAHFSAVRSVHFSPDGEKLVTGSDDKSVKLWSVEGSRKFLNSMTHHSNWVRCTRFSPNGTMVASCADDCSAILWDVREPKKAVQKLEELKSSPQHLAFQPASETIFALAFASGHVRIYDLRAPQHLLQSYKAHNSQVNKIAFHPTGHVMLSASADGEIKVLDLLEGRPIYTLALHKSGVTGVAFSPAGHRFASVGEDKQVIVWKTNEVCESPAPGTPVGSKSSLTSAPRTPVFGDPRSPMPQGWRSLSGKTSVAQAHSKNSQPAVNGNFEKGNTGDIQGLAERVRRLEVFLEISKRPEGDCADAKTLAERITGLEKCVSPNQL